MGGAIDTPCHPWLATTYPARAMATASRAAASFTLRMSVRIERFTVGGGA
jgi:hypothetical protein